MKIYFACNWCIQHLQPVFNVYIYKPIPLLTSLHYEKSTELLLKKQNENKQTRAT